jgi:general secretion pathway protein M
MSNTLDDSLNARQQRWLAVGLLLLACLLVGFIIIMPIINKGLALREQRQNLVFKLQQYERILVKKEVLMASMDSIKQQYAEQNYFYKQTTEALVSAEMQEFIKTVIAEAGGQLSSTQAITPDDSDTSDNTAELSKIAIKVSMIGSSPTLRNVLYKIENALPLMLIDQLEIRSVRGQSDPKTGKTAATNELEISFQAVSFMGATGK